MTLSVYFTSSLRELALSVAAVFSSLIIKYPISNGIDCFLYPESSKTVISSENLPAFSCDIKFRSINISNYGFLESLLILINGLFEYPVKENWISSSSSSVAIGELYLNDDASSKVLFPSNTVAFTTTSAIKPLNSGYLFTSPE